ncbi:MAG: hypothetical protein SNJ82_09400 [Gemmataceae bacterium]
MNQIVDPLSPPNLPYSLGGQYVFTSATDPDPACSSPESGDAGDIAAKGDEAEGVGEAEVLRVGGEHVAAVADSVD